MAGCFTIYFLVSYKSTNTKNEQAMIYVENRKLKLAN